MASLAFVADLKDLTAQGRHVEWNPELVSGLDIRLLEHLVPPTPSGTVDVTDWRDGFRFRLCYYRRGPGFVIVYDRRPVRAFDEMLVDDPAELQLFERLETPGEIGEDESAAERFRATNLLLEHEGLAVMLPYRERRLALPHNILGTLDRNPSDSSKRPVPIRRL